MKRTKKILIMFMMCSVIWVMGKATTVSAAETYSDASQNEYRGQASGGLESVTARATLPLYIVTSDKAAVRNGAGASYKVIGYVYRDRYVKALAVKNGWIQIMYSNKIAYVSKNDLKKI